MVDSAALAPKRVVNILAWLLGSAPGLGMLCRWVLLRHEGGSVTEKAHHPWHTRHPLFMQQNSFPGQLHYKGSKEHLEVRGGGGGGYGGGGG